MGDFGFDPSIILQGKTASLADMLEPARQMQAMQAQRMALADMARKQQQEQAISDVYRQYAGNPSGVSQGLLQIGAGPQALGWMDHQAEAELRNAQTKKASADLVELAKQHVRNQVAAVQSADQYKQLIEGADPQHLAAMGLPAEYDPAKLKMFVAGGIPAEKQLELEQKERALGLRVTDTGSGQRLGYNTETGKYDIPIGTAKPKPVAGPGLRADGSLGGWSDEALNREADAYNISHKMPSIGNNKEAGAIKAEIARRAATRKGADDEGLAGNAAGYTANTNSLKKLQTTADAMQSFEDTALKNLDTALSAAAKIPDAGGALLNKPIRAWASMMGNTDMSAYKAALTTARTEISKVLSGSTGSGAVSDSARHEVEDLMGNDATLAQLQAAAKILRTDMANRKTAVAESIGAIRGRMGGKKAGEPAPDKTAGAVDDTVMVLPPPGPDGTPRAPVPVHKANLPEALRRGGKLVTPGEVATNGR